MDGQLRHPIEIVILYLAILILLLEDDPIFLSYLSLCEESDVKDQPMIDSFINIVLPMLSGRML